MYTCFQNAAILRDDRAPQLSTAGSEGGHAAVVEPELTPLELVRRRSTFGESAYNKIHFFFGRQFVIVSSYPLLPFKHGIAGAACMGSNPSGHS